MSTYHLQFAMCVVSWVGWLLNFYWGLEWQSTAYCWLYD